MPPLLTRGAGRDDIVGWISAAHPGAPLFALDFFNGIDSTRPLLEQLRALVILVQQTQAANPSVFQHGWIGMGHSQGSRLRACILVRSG